MSRTFDPTQIEYVSTGNNAPINNLTAFTLAAWVYMAYDDAVAPTIGVKDPINTYDIAMSLAPSGGQNFLAGGVESADSQSAVPVPVNTWTWVSMTFDLATDGLVHLYINGVEVTYTVQRGISNPLPDDSGGGYYIGGDSYAANTSDGSIAEFAVWNTVLSGAQLAAAYASTTGVSTIAAANLVGYWHLCGTASPEPDASGNGNVGILSVPPPTQGPNSPGYGCGSGPIPPPSAYSVPDCRDYSIFPNDAIDINSTETYIIPSVDSRSSGAPADSRKAGAPIASGVYPQNSRTPGTFGPGE